MTEYYVDPVDGDDANAGTSEGSGNAWLTIQKAADTVVAGTGNRINIKNSADYTEDVDFDTNDGTAEYPIVFEGYTTTIGDGGQSTIDGENTRAHCISLNGVAHLDFRSLILTGATDFCCDVHTATSTALQFINMLFTDGSATGCDGAFGRSSGYRRISDCLIENCIIEDMDADGINLIPFSLNLTNSIIRRCGGDGVDLGTYNETRMNRVLIHDITGDAIKIGNASPSCSINNCTIEDCADGIDVDDNNMEGFIIMNSLITNCTVGIRVTGSPWAGDSTPFCNHNAFYNNGTKTIGRRVDGRDDVALSADPYTAVGSNDYTLNNTAGGGAECRNAGSNNSDIGYWQHDDPAGGSGTTSILGGGNLTGGFA